MGPGKTPSHYFHLPESRAPLLQRGISKITLVVFLAIGAALSYCGYRIGLFYYCYFEMVNQMHAAIRVASTESDQEILKKLAYHLRKLELPAEPQDIKIEREDKVMRISLKYSEVFDIPWQGRSITVHVFKFHAYAEDEF